MYVWKKKLTTVLLRFFIFLRKIKPPGFRGVGLYDVLRFFFKELFDTKFNLMAAAIAYNFFFSLFPALILLFTVIPYIPVKNLETQILTYFEAFMPVDGVVKSIVKDFFQKMGWGLITLNIFLLLRSSVRGIISLMNAFHVPSRNEKRNIFKLYGTALLIFSLLMLFLLVSILLISFGEYALDWLQVHNIIGRRTNAYLVYLNYLITFFVILCSVSIIYYLGGAKHSRFRFFTPGSIIAGTLLLLTLFALNYYFSHFGKYNKIYGSLGTVIVLMLWFYYIAFVLLIGNELNNAIFRAEKYKKVFRSTGKIKPLI